MERFTRNRIKTSNKGKLKVLLLSFLISVALFLGINILTSYLEDVWYEIELAKTPELFIADITERVIDRQIEKLKLDRTRRINLKEAEINTRAAISVKINKKGEEKELFSLNSQDRLPMASISKLMTALVVFETYSFNESIDVEDLLHSMLIESNNESAYTLTEPIGHEEFVDLMNIYAKKIGLNNTYFVNPSGLEPDDPEEVKNYSTAEDLVKLAIYILENQPKIFEITANRKFAYKNTNKLLTRYPEIIGGKTGYSPAAGGCLLIVLEDPQTGDRFINIVLGASDRFLEMTKIINAINPPLGG